MQYNNKYVHLTDSQVNISNEILISWLYLHDFQYYNHGICLQQCRKITKVGIATVFPHFSVENTDLFVYLVAFVMMDAHRIF